jgi:uncharacterized protein DUF1761
MGELTEGVNWLAVGVGTVLSFLLGWVWYSPMLFVKKWIEGINVMPNANAKVPVPAMVMQLIATFLLAWLVGIGAAHNALATTILIVLSIIALFIANGLFGSKSNYAIATEAGFVAAMAVVMIAVQGIL